MPFLAEMQRRSGQNGCNQAGPGVGWDEARNSALVRDRGWVFACLFDFGDSELDWDDVRKRLVDLRVFDLPDPRTLTPEGALVLDGISIEVAIQAGPHYLPVTLRLEALFGGGVFNHEDGAGAARSGGETGPVELRLWQLPARRPVR